MKHGMKPDDGAAVMAELHAMRAGLRAALARIDAIEKLIAPRPASPDVGEPARPKRAAPPRERGTRGRRAPVLKGTRPAHPVADK